MRGPEKLNDSASATGRGDPLRLRPDMASLRLLALDFVRRYIGQWGASPSYGEIAAALDTNRTRVRKAVKSLAADGLLLRTPGARGLALPETRESALHVLRALGWDVDGTTRAVRPPPGVVAVTNTPLQAMPLLDYLPDAPGVDNQGEAGSG